MVFVFAAKGDENMAKKRANGEGSIRKRSDGRWEGRYTAGRNPTTGKPIYKNVLGKTQTEVKEKLKIALTECEKIDVYKSAQYTVGEWMDVWFENYAAIKVRPSSHQTYKGYIEHHITPDTRSIGKVRYSHRGADCTLTPMENGMIKCVFDEPQRAMTPGQAAVFYQDGHVLCGGTIEKMMVN